MVIVSFPRSGQNLLESIFRKLSPALNIDHSYCEFYSCCKQIPCKAGCKISKNHDFDLKLKILDEMKYISIYRRDPILQLEAYYRFSIKFEKSDYNYDSLLLFIKNNIDYYQSFLNKWIYNDNNNILKIEYYDFVSDPNFYVKLVFDHFYKGVDLSSIDNLSSIEFDVFNPMFNSSDDVYLTNNIKLLNNLSYEIYNQLKTDLGYLIK
jgi:hypothetical protein